jgi:hypothetical protein
MNLVHCARGEPDVRIDGSNTKACLWDVWSFNMRTQCRNIVVPQVTDYHPIQHNKRELDFPFY